MKSPTFGFARGIAIATAAFMVLPVLVIIPAAFAPGETLQITWSEWSVRWFVRVLENRSWVESLKTSVVVGIATMLLSTALGVPAALALTNGASRLSRMLHLFFVSPLFTPVVVLAIGIYFVLVRAGLAGSMAGLVVAHTVLATPFLIVTVVSALSQVSPSMAEASLSLGAGPVRTFWKVTLPLIAPGVGAGMILAFVTSWDEVVMAIFLTTPTLITAPALIWQQLKSNLSPEIAAVGVILITLSTVCAVGAFAMIGRKGSADR